MRASRRESEGEGPGVFPARRALFVFPFPASCRRTSDKTGPRGSLFDKMSPLKRGKPLTRGAIHIVIHTQLLYKLLAGSSAMSKPAVYYFDNNATTRIAP